MKRLHQNQSVFAATHRLALLFCFPMLLAACGGGGGGGGVSPPPLINHAVQGHFVVRVQGSTEGYAALEEAITPYYGGPPSAAISRRIRIGGQAGVEDVYLPPEGWSLIDMARHPSGELSAVLATQRELSLVRLDARAGVISATPMIDAAAAHDPYYDFGGIRDDTSLLPLHTRDTVRLAAWGEDLAVVLRTGRHAVVAYRYGHIAPNEGYRPRWRRLVEPGTTVMARHLMSGSHDTYGQLINHFQVLLATNAQGEMAIAVPATPHNGAFAAHATHFLSGLKEGTVLPDYGAIITRLDGSGERLGASFFDAGGPAQAHALRAYQDGWALAGRHRVADQEGGWNGFAVWLDAEGRLRRHTVLDVEEGDVLFDLVPLPDGRHLVAGATGYSQNPIGASISDEGAPLLAVLEADGRMARRLPLPTAPGQNPVRSLERQGNRWLVAGMRGGPGTHTADGDPARLRADGYVLEVDVFASAASTREAPQ